MESSKASGRTIGDTVIEVLSNGKLIFVAFGALLVAFLVVVNDAEPGSTVKVFGIEYQRAKPKPEAPHAQNALPSTYVLPAGEIVKVDQQKALLILDGSLAIQPRVFGGSDSTGKRLSFLGGASIVGPNISKIKIASRSLDGKTASLDRPYKVDLQADFSLNSYVELEYRGRYFSILTEDAASESMKITVKSIQEPTLELVPVTKLPEAGGSD